MAAGAQTAVTIGTAKDPNLASQIVIAREKGFFKEAGVNVTVNYFPSGGDLMAAVVGHSVEMGSSGSTPTITLRARPYPIKILSQIADISGAEQIIVNASITSHESLWQENCHYEKYWLTGDVRVVRQSVRFRHQQGGVRLYGTHRDDFELFTRRCRCHSGVGAFCYACTKGF